MPVISRTMTTGVRGKRKQLAKSPTMPKITQGFTTAVSRPLQATSTRPTVPPRKPPLMSTGSRTSPGARTEMPSTMAATLPAAKARYCSARNSWLKACCSDSAPTPQTPRRPVALKTQAPMPEATRPCSAKAAESGSRPSSRASASRRCSQRMLRTTSSATTAQRPPIGTAMSIQTYRPNASPRLSPKALSRPSGPQFRSKMVLLPWQARTVAVETTEATRMMQIMACESRGETCCSSSIEKRIPDRGALKDAAKPQAKPREASSDCVAAARMPMSQPRSVAMEVQTWMAGPSMPREPPEPR
mmetsp:Transcript_66654/g.206472  ORF Transcript_66654/g.206472 Transcript_66654/m.206472 type:complete len:302 (+) Transcript_66654:244-1149(+)